MVDPKKKMNPNDDDDQPDNDKTTEINSNELTTPIDPASNEDTSEVSSSNKDSQKSASQDQRKTVVRRGNNRSSQSVARPGSKSPRSKSPGSKSPGSSPSASTPGSGKHASEVAAPTGTTKVKPSLMAGDNIDATINSRELTGEDAEIWATVIADTSIDKIVGGKSGLAMQTEETIDGSQIASTFATELSVDGQTAEVPAIERTVSDRNFDRLRICELTPLKTEPKSNSDYRLIRKLGQGGMGDVFVARQGSLDRLLALKLIKPIEGKRRQKLMQTGRLEEVEQERRLQFLSEAIVTGDLDHPNIVPIHDVALTPEGDLFYSMKRVVGTPWSDEIKKMSVSDNLEVLMRVCDAIAQAHTRGVVHRDIKPENIMLGEFGVVMVMDWGLALPTARYTEKRDSSLLTSSGLGGTPAFMSPEMAMGPVEQIGNTADVYLLGATLFMIVTGKAPHHASTVTECLQAVRENKIREVDPEHQGELLDIAYRAMETDPADRYESVTVFQEAVRDFVRHSGSIQQSWQASQSLELGIQNSSYEYFSKARYQYEAALRQWNENIPAAEGLEQTLVHHADAALENEDFDLGLSLLDQNRSDHQSLIKRLIDGKKQRASRESGLRLMKKVAAAMLLFIVVGGGVAMAIINQKRNQATNAFVLAEKQRTIAVKQTEVAERQRIEAEQQREIAESESIRANKLAVAEQIAKQEAEDQAAKAIKAEKLAVTAKLAAEESRAEAVEKHRQAIAATKRANYEEYVSKIGLAKAHLERNESEVARQILRELKEKSPYTSGWEWRWLWQQADGAESETKLNESVIDLTGSPEGNFGAVLLSNGQVKRWNVTKAGLPSLKVVLPLGAETVSGSRDPATAVSVSSDPQRLATGHQSGQIVIVDGNDSYLIGTHEDAVTDLDFVGVHYLVSSSADRTVRVWDLQRKNEITQSDACWHGAPVQHIAAVRKNDGLMIAAATSNDTSGSIALWNVPLTTGTGTPSRKPQNLGTFRGHAHPVSSVSFGPNGQLAASGDNDGNVLIWNPMSVEAADYESAIASALASISDKQKGPVANDPVANVPNQTTKHVRLIDDDVADRESKNRSTLVSKSDRIADPIKAIGKAHGDIVRAIAFDRSGRFIVTASNDYTLKKWDVGHRRILKKMRGHGGWVTGVQFLANPNGDHSRESDDQSRIISSSRDQTIRVWNPTTFVAESIEPALPTTAMPHNVDISSVRFSPDGTRVLTASADHTAAVMTIDPTTFSFRDVVRLDPERLAEGTAYVGMSMVTDDRERYLFIGSADSTVRIWDIQKGSQLGEVTGTGLNDSIAVSGDGTLLLTGSASPKTKAILWKVDPTRKAKAKILHRLRGHDQAVTAFAVSNDGKRLFTGDSVGYGILWDATTGKPIGKPIENVRGFRIGAAKFSRDSKSLWLGSDDGQLTQVDLASRQNLRRLNHDGFVTKLSISKDQHYAVTVSELLMETKMESKATLWDLQSGHFTTLAKSSDPIGTEEKSGSRSRERVTAAAFEQSHSGKSHHTVVVCQSDAKGRSAIKVWKDASRALAGKPDLALALPSRLGVAQTVLPIGDGRCMTLNQNAVFDWKLSDGKLRHSYRAHARLTESAFSPDGKWIATLSRSIKLWNAATGQSVAKIESPHIGPVRSIDFHPTTSHEGGYRFSTGGDDGMVRFWKWQPGQAPVQDHQCKLESQDESDDVSRINVIRYSPDGKQLLVAGHGGVARILRLSDGVFDCESSLNLPLNDDHSDTEFLCGSFSRDGDCVALGGDDDQARVWNLGTRNGAPVTSVVLTGHADVIQGIKIAGDHERGYRVFTASSDDSVKIWDPSIGDGDVTTQGREILTLEKHRGDVTAIDLSDDERLLMTAGKNGQVILWPAQPTEDISVRLFE